MTRFIGDEGGVTYSTFKVDYLTVDGFNTSGDPWGEYNLALGNKNVVSVM